MRRVLGAVLIGLGALLLVLAVGMPTFLEPALAQIPATLQPCKAGSRTEPAGCLAPVDAKAANATYLQFDAAGAHINTGDLITTFEIVPQTQKTADVIAAGKLESDAQIWDVYQTTKDATGIKVQQVSAEFALDRKTGAAVPWDGQFLNDGSEVTVKWTGNEYQFPFGAEKKDYPVFDENIKATTTGKFTSTDNIDGLDTYHYVMHVPSTELSLPREQLSALQQLFAPKATSAKLMYTDDKEVWIDPATGVLVKVSDHQVKTLVADDGTQKVLLDGNFQSLDSEIAETVSSAKKNGQQLRLIGVYAPIGLGIVGLILLIAGYLVLRGGSRTADAAAWDDNMPEPRHRLRGDETVASGSEAPPWPGN